MRELEVMQELLQKSLQPKRFKHSVRVYETALELANNYGLPQGQIAVSALLHDCGREISSKDSVAKARELGIPVDEIELHQPILLHGMLGAYFAVNKYGVDDQQILDGIIYHTTGRAGMSVLEKIVFLADMIEPGRDFPGVEELRRLSFKNLDRAMLVAYQSTIEYLLRGNLLVHPHAVEGYNELIVKYKK